MPLSDVIQLIPDLFVCLNMKCFSLLRSFSAPASRLCASQKRIKGAQAMAKQTEKKISRKKEQAESAHEV